MVKYVNDTSAGKSIKAYVVMKGAKHIATVTAHYANSGNMLLNIQQWGESVIRSYNAANKTKLKTKDSDYPSYADFRAATDICQSYGFQSATCSGGGYDKFASAINRMVIDGHILADHCAIKLKTPKTNMGLFPKDFKAPKGYRLANYTERNARGVTVNERSFIDKANSNLGFSADNPAFTDEHHFTIMKERRSLYMEWQKSDDCFAGYTSCFRDSGLDYLRALGYTIIQVL